MGHLSLELRRRRARFRAAHRGTKEMDWLLGRYAESELEGMDEGVLGVFERLLEQSDPDLNNWILDPEKTGDQMFQPLILALRSFHGLDDPSSGGLR